ncbi:GNAT family N-acetyltransferase [Micavibrio aeruginosavorus]|uniref:GNAT family N-acetyltransferase n=1 Tax=Micavibrio aeruginosavorus TaxID=349221 RepID=UPI003F4AF263
MNIANLLRPAATPTRSLSLSLSGERVVIRYPERRDLDQWIAVRQRNRSYLQPFEPTWPGDALTPAAFNRRLSRQQREIRAGHTCPFLIFRLDNLHLVGAININNIVRGPAQFASMGYWLDEQSQGQGYMTEAGMLALGYAFGPLKLHRLYAGCVPHNGRSKSLLTRLGFEEEGYAKRYLQINGEWQDHIMFGLSIETWKTTLPGSTLSVPA